MENDKSRPGGRERFTTDEVIAALEASAGIIAAAARILQCHAKTVKGYVARHADVAAALDEIIEDRLDAAEASLLRMMSDSSNPNIQLNAAIFYLRTRGKARGYTIGAEVTGKNGGAIEYGNKVSLDLSQFSTEDLIELEQHARAAVQKL